MQETARTYTSVRTHIGAPAAGVHTLVSRHKHAARVAEVEVDVSRRKVNVERNNLLAQLQEVHHQEEQPFSY